MKIVNCVVCGQRIDTKKDNFYKVELYGLGKKTGTAYAHCSCYHQKNNNETKLMNLAEKLMSGVQSLGILPPEEFKVIGEVK